MSTHTLEHIHQFSLQKSQCDGQERQEKQKIQTATTSEMLSNVAAAKSFSNSFLLSYGCHCYNKSFLLKKYFFFWKEVYNFNYCDTNFQLKWILCVHVFLTYVLFENISDIFDCIAKSSINRCFFQMIVTIFFIEMYDSH